MHKVDFEVYPRVIRKETPNGMLNANLREIMIAFNHCVGFTLFNSPRAFLVYLSISLGIAVEHLIYFLRDGTVKVVSDKLQDIFVHGYF